MPIKADAVIWNALRGACKTYKNDEVTDSLNLIQMAYRNGTLKLNYVNVVQSMTLEDGRHGKLKLATKDNGFRELPGCSSID